MKKFLSLLIVLFLFSPSYGATKSRVVYNNQKVDQVIIEQKVIKFDDFNQLRVIAIPVTNYGPQYYYEAEPLRRNQNLSQEDIDKIVQGVVDGIINQLEVVGEDGEAGNSPADPDKPQNPPVGTPDKPDLSSLDAQVLHLFSNKCYHCHDSSSHQGNLILVSDDESLADLTDRQVAKVIRRTVGGFGLDPQHRMPLNSDALPQEEIELLQKWADERFAKAEQVAEDTNTEGVK